MEKNIIDNSDIEVKSNEGSLNDASGGDGKKPKKGFRILKIAFNMILMAILFGGVASAVFLVVTDTLKKDENGNTVYIATSIPYIGETKKENTTASDDDKEVLPPVASAVDVSDVVESVSPALVTINGYSLIEADNEDADADLDDVNSDKPDKGIRESTADKADDSEKVGRKKEDNDSESLESKQNIKNEQSSNDKAEEQQVEADEEADEQTSELELTISKNGVIVGQNKDAVMILTSYSDLEACEAYTVTFSNGGECEASLKGYDEELDIAVFSIDFSKMSADDINYIRIINMGDSQAAKVGQLVIACSDRIFVGYISSASKKINYMDVDYSVLKTDITSNEEGFILINSNAELLGITTNAELLEGDILPVSMLKAKLLEIIEKEPEVATASDATVESDEESDKASATNDGIDSEKDSEGDADSKEDNESKSDKASKLRIDSEIQTDM
jgi:S1-C subfamily serine protease